MANVVRCDDCRRLSDEQNVGYIGKDWILRKFRDVVATIKTNRDLCRDCLFKNSEANSLERDDKDDF